MAHVQLASFAQKSAKKIWSRPSHALTSPLSCVRGSSTSKFLRHALPTSRIHNSLVISLNRCSARFCTTKATESKSSDANEASQVARIVATPSGSQYTASSDQLKALLIESENRRNRLLIWAIAAFLTADLVLALLYYFVSDDDPESATYVPSDWKDLVLVNLGLSRPSTAPPHFIGTWKASDDETLVFHPQGKFNHTVTFSDTREMASQSVGIVSSSDPGYITVKTTTIERIRISSPPRKTESGWTVHLNGKEFTKTATAKESL